MEYDPIVNWKHFVGWFW